MPDGSAVFSINTGGVMGAAYENMKHDYKHLLGSSNAYSTMHCLNSYGRAASIWSFPVPDNYQIGNVGNSGKKTTNPHLHLQNNRY